MIGGLESRVAAESEILLALQVAQAQPKGAKKEESSLERAIDSSAIPEELIEVIEQELDTESYVHQEYEIGVYGEKSSYDYQKELAAEGNSVSYSIETTEHEVLESVQEANQDAKSAHIFKEVDVGKIDDGRRHELMCFKMLYGQTMSFLMYAGELHFN